MANYTLQTPSVPNFAATNVLTGVKLSNSVKYVMDTYGKSLKFVEVNCKVPMEITASLMLAISGGKVDAFPKTSFNYGIMGWSLAYGAPDAAGKRMNAKEVLNFELLQRRMTTNEVNKLKSLGLVYDGKTGGFPNLTQANQANAEISILYAAIFLGQCMDSKVFGINQANWAVGASGAMLLERIIVVYLNGADMSKDSVKKAVLGYYPNALTLMKDIQATDPLSASVINKTLGTGGYLDSLANGWQSPYGGSFLPYKNI